MAAMTVTLTAMAVMTLTPWQGLAPMHPAAVTSPIIRQQNYPQNTPVLGPYPPHGTDVRGELAPLPIAASEAVREYFSILMDDLVLAGATFTVKDLMADYEIERERHRWPDIKPKTFSQILVDDLGCKRGTLDKRKGGKGERLTTITLPDGDIGP